jgi:two-component system, NarL family, sensor kinase
MMTSAQEKNSLIRTEMLPIDSLRINALIQKANQYQNTEPDSTIFLSRKALEQSIAYGYHFGSGLSLANMATAYRNKGAYDKSLQLYRQAISYVQQQTFYRDYYLAATYNTMFGVYFHLGMFDSAALNCYKVIALYRNSGNKKINPVDGDVDPLIDAYQYLSICWLQLGYYQRSLNYIQEAEQRSLKDKKKYQLLTILANKSSIYQGLNEPEQAMATAQQGMRLSDSFKNTSLNGIFRSNIAAALLKQGKTDTALLLLRQLLADEAKQHNTTPPDVATAFTLGYAYFQKNQFNEALAVLLPALKRANELSQRYNTILPYDILAQTYEALGEEQKAYETLRIKEALEDTLTYRAVQMMNMMDIAMQTAEKDKKISQNQLKISQQQHRLQQQYTWIIVISCSAVLLIILLIVLYRSYRNRRQRQEEKILLISKEQEVLQLRALMQGEEQERARFARELHDGFVSQLSAIKMNFSAMDEKHFSAEQQLDNIQQLDDTIRELRKTAHNLMPEILLNAGLAEATQLYCDRINQAHALWVDFRTYGFLPKLNAAFELPLYRMIQESVQNIIKHSGAGQAIVQFNYDNNILGITIEDNGCGFDEPGNTGQGMGLQSFKARVESMGGHFQLSSTKDTGTTLYFEFDLSTNEYFQ